MDQRGRCVETTRPAIDHLVREAVALSPDRPPGMGEENPDRTQRRQARNIGHDDLVPSIRATRVPTLADPRRRRAALGTPRPRRRHCHHGGHPTVVPGCRSTGFQLVGVPAFSADLRRTSETVSPKCPPAPSVAIPASRYHMWAEARRTQGRLGRTLGPVKTAAVLADTRTDDVLEVGVDRAVTRFGAEPGTQDLQPNSQRSAAVCRSTRFSISPFRTQVHELSPHRPSGEPTPASGLPAQGSDRAEPETWPGRRLRCSALVRDADPAGRF